MLQITVFTSFKRRGFLVLLCFLFTIDIFAQNEIPGDGLILWLKADVGLTTTDNGDGTTRVDSWADQSHTITGVNTGYYFNNDDNEDDIVIENNVVNSTLPAVLFPGRSQRGLTLTGHSGDNFLLKNYEVFVVLKATSAGDTDVGFFAGGNNFRSLYGMWNSERFYMRGAQESSGGNTDIYTWPIAPDKFAWGLVSFQRNTSYETDFTANGGTFTNLPINSSDAGDNRLGIIGGADNDTNLGWSGYIAEVIIYNKTTGLDPVTRLRVNDYLTAKYGFTHEEFSDTDELFNGNTTPNQNIVVHGNDGGVYTPDRSYPSTTLDVSVSSSVDDDYLVVGETDESGLVFTNAPEDKRIWAKKFYLQKNGDLEFTLSFDVQTFEGKPNDYDTGDGAERSEADYALVYSSDNATEYVILDGVNASFNGDDFVEFTVSDADYDVNGDGFYTLASKAPEALYTKGTGKWDDPIWTTNPSGASDGLNLTPGIEDNVIIKSGHVVTIDDNNVTLKDVTVDKGGKLIVGNTTGHTFESLSGKGIIQVEGDNFPSPSTATGVGGFLTSDGGIVEFIGSGGTLTNSHSYNIVHVNLDNTSDELILDTSSPISIYDSLLITKGEVILGTSDATGEAVDFTVNGNVRIAGNGALGVGTDNVVHNITLKSSLYNSGTIALTNRAKITEDFGSEDYLTDLETYFSTNLSGQYAIITFDADNKDQDLIVNGSTILYQIVVDKGTSDYYNLNISAGSEELFEMYGYNIHANASTGGTDGSMTTSNGMFVMKYGTIHFGQNIYIPSYANTPDNYDLGFGCRIWVDEGADVNFGPVNALTVYGNVLVTGGRFNIGLNSDGTSNGKHNSITLREKGYFVQEGGQVFLNQIKTSNLGVDHQGSFTMSGGEMTIYGYVPGSNVAAFSLPYKTNSFNMSGGTITIHNQGSTVSYLAKFAMEDGFYNVTGGEIVLDINSDKNASFVSSIPFYNLTVTTDYPSRNVSLTNGSGTFGDALPNEGNLNVLNHLVIEENSNLQVGEFDVTISGDLTLYNDSQLNIDENNTLTFNGSSVDDEGNVLNHYIDIRDTDTPYEINNLVIDLPNATDVLELRDISDNASVGDTRLKVMNSLSLTQGIFDYTDYVIEVEGDLSFEGKIGQSDSPGHIILNGSAGTAQKISSSYDLVDAQIADTTNVGIAHLWLNNADGVELSNIIYGTKITWQQGIIKSNEYGVVVGQLGIVDDAGNPINDFASNVTNKRMIVGSGNSSDGGLTYLVKDNGDFIYPLASDFDTPVANSYKFTPATLTVKDHIAEGFIQLAPNNGDLSTWTSDRTTDDLLDYYWKSTNHNFSGSEPNVEWVFKYHQEDIVADASTYVPARVQLEADHKERESLGDTDDVDIDGSDANATDYTITIKPSPSVKAYNSLYTAGSASKFTGELTVYYSYRGYAEDNPDGSLSNRHESKTNKYDSSIPDGFVEIVNEADWNYPERWSTNPNWITDGNPISTQGIPGEGDIVVIGHGSSKATITQGHRVIINSSPRDIKVGIVRFDSHESASLEKADLARIRLENGSLTVDVIEDIGSLRLHKGTTFNGTDINDFLSEERSEIMIQSNESSMEIPVFSKYPSVRLWGGGSYNYEFTFASSVDEPVQFKSLMIDGGTLILDKSIEVENSINVGGYREAALEINSASEITITTSNINLENTISTNSSTANKFLVTGTDDIVHSLIVKGDITIPEKNADEDGEGGIEFSLLKSETENRVVLEFQGQENGVFDNFYSDAGITPELYKIKMNKGTNQNPSFSFNTNFTLPSITTEELITFENGTLVFNNSNINITPFAVASSIWDLASTAGLTINQGTVNITGDGSNLLLGGKLTVGGGTLNLSNASQENSIVYSVTGEIELTGGAINVGSELRRDLASNDASLYYKQSGGVFTTGLQGNPNSATRGTFEVLGTESSFDFSGGEIIVHSGKIALDAATSSVVESAEIKLGNNSTTETIDVELANEVGKIELIADVTADVVINDIQMAGDLEIPSTATLNLNSRNLSTAGSITNEGTLNASTSTISMVGSNAQSISGSNAITTQNMIVATEGSTVTMNADITVSNDLTITSGVFSDNNNTVNVGGNLNVEGSHTTTGTGRIKLNGSSAQSIDISGSLGRMEIDNSNGINLENNIALVAEEIVFTNGVLNIDIFGLNLGSDISLVATTAFDKDNMIQLNGGLNAKGVQIELPSDAIATEKVIPIGYPGTYAPVGFFGDFDGASAVIKPINTMHTVAANDGVTDHALEQFWRFEFSEEGVAKERYVSLYFNAVNVKGTKSNYQGVIIDNDANIRKPINITDGLSDDLTNNKIKINLNSPLITGDYFAAEDDATPDNIIRYKLKDGVTDASLDDVGSGKWEVSTDGGGSYSDLGSALTSGTILEVPAGVNLETTSLGDLGFKSYYRAIINGTLEVHVRDRDIVFNDVIGDGKVKFYINSDTVGQMPFADWEDFYTSGGGIIVEGNATNPLLSLNAPVSDDQLTIGSLELIGTGSDQVWELPDGNGLNMASGDLTINNVEFEIGTPSTVNNIIIEGGGIFTSNTSSSSVANADVSVASGSSFNVSAGSFNIKGSSNVIGTLKLENSSDLTVDNDITMASGSTLDLSLGSELALGGDFIDNGTSSVNLTGATLTFNGSTGDQNFSGNFTSADSKSIDNLKIDKSSGEVLLDSGSTKEINKLILNSVLNNTVNFDGSLLILGETSDVTGNSYVDGPLSKKMDEGESFVFQVGGSGSQRKLQVIYKDDTDAVTGTEKTWTVEHSPDTTDLRLPIVDGINIAVVSKEYQWRVTDMAHGESGLSSDADVYAYYESLGKSSSYALAIWDPFPLFGSSEWDKAGDPLHNTDDYFETFNVGFSEKYLAIGAIDESTDLPVELISFDAIAEVSQVKLEWSTASEVNNDGFEVQRSIDGENWSSIGRIEGAGNSSVRLDYLFIDDNPVMNQMSYYRLIQTDFDGTETIFDPVPVLIEGNAAEAGLVVYPNPVHDGKLNVLLKSWKGDVEIGLYTTLGYKVISDQWTYGDSQTKELKVGNLPRGVYLLRLKSGKTVKSKRVIIE
ncbi:T9SS type A sorting domain-containing protein [Flammeovirga sp. EKP202]|uniref:T9SS type A sorting domain-containing protein n=1 Tax=Flammeovirga sp. EKP202 TaxID=2770592 RepID=UPI00166003E0|nr:T9SS type A sorting domain-containing protein [Flammeovirga sp. EKP202]MBD0400743.1 T9SS type A sorting domain-containing protein [Flammeovirga sp. EKP202]